LREAYYPWIDLKASDYPTGTVAIATQAYPSERKAATMISDSRYLDMPKLLSKWAVQIERAGD